MTDSRRRGARAARSSVGAKCVVSSNATNWRGGGLHPSAVHSSTARAARERSEGDGRSGRPGAVVLITTRAASTVWSLDPTQTRFVTDLSPMPVPKAPGERDHASPTWRSNRLQPLAQRNRTFNLLIKRPTAGETHAIPGRRRPSVFTGFAHPLLGLVGQGSRRFSDNSRTQTLSRPEAPHPDQRGPRPEGASAHADYYRHVQIETAPRVASIGPSTFSSGR